MARKKTGRRTRSRRGGATTRGSVKRHGPAAAALAEDHRRVEALFGAYVASADDAEKQRLVEEVCAALIVHTAIEEEIFYPACRDRLAQDEIVDVAQVEHDSTKPLIADLLDGDGDDAWRDAKVEVLAAQVGHHVAEEEKSDGIFAQTAQHGIDTDELARRLLERKQALQRRAAELRPTRAISLLQPPMEDAMARYSGNERERDERGRFTSDDDDDRRGYRSSSGRSRSRYDDDDDDRGGRGHGRGGWFGDSEGHSRAARSRRDDDDDDRGGQSRGGGRSRGRDDDDDSRGWHGDSRGHAEAARRGWAHRR